MERRLGASGDGGSATHFLDLAPAGMDGIRAPAARVGSGFIDTRENSQFDGKTAEKPE